MWTWTLNWDEIRPDIIIGSCPREPGDIDKIHEKAAPGAILCLQHDACLAHFRIRHSALAEKAKEHGITLIRAPMLDFNTEDQRRNLPQAIRALHHALTRHGRTYVHCTAGINRASLVVMAYMILVESYKPDEVLSLIREKRATAEPDMEAFRGFLEDLTHKYRPAIEEKAYHYYEKDDRGAGKNWERAAKDIFREKILPESDGRGPAP